MLNKLPTTLTKMESMLLEWQSGVGEAGAGRGGSVGRSHSHLVLVLFKEGHGHSKYSDFL